MMAPSSTMDSRSTARSAHPSAGRTPHPPTTSKREDKSKRDSVASSRYLEVPNQSRMDSSRNTSTMRSSDRGSRGSRGDSTAKSVSSSRAPRTDREHGEREKSTASTIKAGSVLGSDSHGTVTRSNSTRQDRPTGRFDKSRVPSTIYEDDCRAGSSAPRSSRYDTVKPTDYETSKGGYLVFYDSSHGPSTSKSGAAVRCTGSGCSPSRYDGDMGTMNRLQDKTISAAVREAIAQPGVCAVYGTHTKERTASGTIVEVKCLEIYK